MRHTETLAGSAADRWEALPDMPAGRSSHDAVVAYAMHPVHRPHFASGAPTTPAASPGVGVITSLAYDW